MKYVLSRQRLVTFFLSSGPYYVGVYILMSSSVPMVCHGHEQGVRQGKLCCLPHAKDTSRELDMHSSSFLFKFESSLSVCVKFVPCCMRVMLTRCFEP